MNAVLKIRPDLMAELDHLAVETHRSESDIINEALESYLAHIQKQTVTEVIARIKATRHKSTLEGIDLREAIEEGRD
ncbi:MAG: ribbon-helix-helix domain-containing protein [Sulfuricella sp.]|nr:ribbon-helix-helix domain-containing protein [Sulfuricella sp.]